MSDLCGTCGKAKEPTRAKSKKCRACDGASKARKQTVRTEHRRLTLDLPVDVWDRLDEEAQTHGQRIAGYTQMLINKRDEKMEKKRNG